MNFESYTSLGRGLELSEESVRHHSSATQRIRSYGGSHNDEFLYHLKPSLAPNELHYYSTSIDHPVQLKIEYSSVDICHMRYGVIVDQQESGGPSGSYAFAAGKRSHVPHSEGRTVKLEQIERTGAPRQSILECQMTNSHFPQCGHEAWPTRGHALHEESTPLLYFSAAPITHWQPWHTDLAEVIRGYNHSRGSQAIVIPGVFATDNSEFPTPNKCVLPQMSPTSESISHQISQNPQGLERQIQDQFLVESKLSGMSYREIKIQGRFTEAESTLRGRYRNLTKCKEQRVRRPQWEGREVRN